MQELQVMTLFLVKMLEFKYLSRGDTTNNNKPTIS